MTQIPIPKHVFVSYSHHDKKMVDKIIKALEEAGISCWVDRKGIIPGTASWEAMIRDAIRDSFAVLFLASPHSGQSTIVRGELSVARSQECPIYLLWIKGNEWIDCAPLDMVQAQYIDCRRRRYAAGVSLVIETLKALIDKRLPKHLFFTYSEYNKYSSWGSGFFYYRRYLVIRISDDQLVAMRIASYPSLQLLLDDLYMHYLRDRYKPYTYGTDWILRRGSVLIAPWAILLKEDHQSLFRKEAAAWFASALEGHRELELASSRGIVGGILDISEGSLISAIGLVTNNLNFQHEIDNRKFEDFLLGRIVDKINLPNALSRFTVAASFGHWEWIFREVRPEEIDIKRYKCSFLLYTRYSELAGKAFIVEDEENYL